MENLENQVVENEVIESQVEGNQEEGKAQEVDYKAEYEKLLQVKERAEIAEQRAELAEIKLICSRNGVNEKNVDEVIYMAKYHIDDKTTMEQAIKKVVNKYPDVKFNKNNEPFPQVVLPTGGKTQLGRPKLSFGDFINKE